MVKPQPISQISCSPTIHPGSCARLTDWLHCVPLQPACNKPKFVANYISIRYKATACIGKHYRLTIDFAVLFMMASQSLGHSNNSLITKLSFPFCTGNYYSLNKSLLTRRFVLYTKGMPDTKLQFTCRCWLCHWSWSSLIVGKLILKSLYFYVHNNICGMLNSRNGCMVSVEIQKHSYLKEKSPFVT